MLRSSPTGVRGNVNPSFREPLLGALRALAQPIRFRILQLLASPPGPRAGPVGEREPGLCLSDLEARLGQSHALVCHHVAVLQRAGLVVRLRRGRWTLLQVNPRRLAALGEHLVALTPGEAPAGGSAAADLAFPGPRSAA